MINSALWSLTLVRKSFVELSGAVVGSPRAASKVAGVEDQ